MTKKLLKLSFIFLTGTIFLTTAFAQKDIGWSILREASNNEDLVTVYFANGERGWVGGDNGYLAVTKDGGKTWTRQILSTTATVNDVYFRGTDKGYVLAGEKIFTSTDGGQIWREEQIFKKGAFGTETPEFSSLRFVNKKKGWIVGSLSENDSITENLVLQTTDGGENWKRLTVPTTEQLLHVDFINETTGWMVGALGTVLATTDGGATWKWQRSGTTGTLYHVDFKNEQLGWIVGEKGLILRTENAGKTWTQIRTIYPNTFLSVGFINDQTGWIIGRGGIILRSDDGGKTWIKQDGKTKQNLFALYMDKKTGWAVGTKGTILKYGK